MIPKGQIIHWRQYAPWLEDNQVEQDLIISRALIELFSHQEITRALAFRGGTALHKLHLKPARYSEDLDFVQVHQEPIGQTIDAVRASLSPWLGESVNYEQKHARFTLHYEVNSEADRAPPIRLKVEINTREHFTVEGYVQKPFEVDSAWFQGTAQLRTYSIEEMLGTKLRALYQRDKGRDLFDLWYALETADLNTDKVVDICRKYLDFGDHSISRAEFEQNLHEKRRNKGFQTDVDSLLSPEIDWSIDDAMDAVLSEFIPEFPGDPWEGGD